MPPCATAEVAPACLLQITIWLDRPAYAFGDRIILKATMAFDPTLASVEKSFRGGGGPRLRGVVVRSPGENFAYDLTVRRVTDGRGVFRYASGDGMAPGLLDFVLVDRAFRLTWDVDLAGRRDVGTLLMEHPSVPSGEYEVQLHYRHHSEDESWFSRMASMSKHGLGKSLLHWQKHLCRQDVHSNVVRFHFRGYHDLPEEKKAKIPLLRYSDKAMARAMSGQEEAEENRRRILRETDPTKVSCYACSVGGLPHADPTLPSAVLVVAVVLLGRRRIRRPATWRATAASRGPARTGREGPSSARRWERRRRACSSRPAAP